MTAERARPRARFEIDLLETDPPTGRVRIEGANGVEELAFEGWLGLLGTIERHVSPTDAPSLAGDDGMPA